MPPAYVDTSKALWKKKNGMKALSEKKKFEIHAWFCYDTFFSSKLFEGLPVYIWNLFHFPWTFWSLLILPPVLHQTKLPIVESCSSAHLAETSRRAPAEQWGPQLMASHVWIKAQTKENESHKSSGLPDPHRLVVSKAQSDVCLCQATQCPLEPVERWPRPVLVNSAVISSLWLDVYKS